MSDEAEEMAAMQRAIRERFAHEWPAFYFNNIRVDGCAYLLDLACTWYPVPKETDSFFFHFCCCIGGERREASSTCVRHFRELRKRLDSDASSTAADATGDGVPRLSRDEIVARWKLLLDQLTKAAGECDECRWVAHFHGVTDRL